MDRDVRRPEIKRGSHSARDRIRNIVKFQIEEQRCIGIRIAYLCDAACPVHRKEFETELYATSGLRHRGSEIMSGGEVRRIDRAEYNGKLVHQLRGV